MTETIRLDCFAVTDRSRIAYLTSRFPRTSETFIARELDALARKGTFDLELYSLFASPDTVQHDVARQWTAKLQRPSLGAGIVGLGWAVRRRPRALRDAVVTVVREHCRRPGILARAAVTLVLACAHARHITEKSAVRHIHAHYASYPALAAWVCHRLTGVGYSFTVHAHDLYVDSSMLPTKVADARFVVTISRFNEAILRTIGGPEAAIEVVRCGIDLSRYRFHERTIPEHGPVTALCVASLQEYKGHRFLLEALAAGGPQLSRLHLDLIGAGHLETELRGLATRLGVSDRVRFLGARDESYVAQALADADLFVLPSVVAQNGQMEGLPVALMESLASGVPTVASDLSGIPEIILDGVTGLLAPPGDSASLATALESMMTNPDLVRRCIHNGRALVEREFELNRNVDTLAGLFDRHVTQSR